MSDKQQQTVSTLAIAEKRPQRTGGCVGIFLQLFDWNRRSARKKLFSKKLLPPARLKRVTKIFGGGNKLPMGKLLLIADENRGGFPKKPEVDDIRCSSAIAKQKGEMRTPNLVARLMGLESMPPVPHDKKKKASFSEFGHDQETNPSGRSEFFCYEQGQIFEKGHGKLDLRPQKLQKTVSFERSSVSKFGAEELQFRTVLSRSRKQHQKLVSPVKSPRSLSGRNAARLMEAAAKILEPSLQASNRAKCSLTYSAPSNHYAHDVTKRQTTLSSLKPLKGQTSCNSCGNLLDVVDFASNVVETPEFMSSSSEFSDASSHDSGRSKLNYALFSCDMKKEGENGRDGLLRAGNTKGSPAVQALAQAHVQSCDEQMMEKEAACEGLHQCIKPQHNVAPHVLKQSKQKLTEMIGVKGNVSSDRQVARRPFASDIFNGAKDYVSLNRNMTYQSRTRMQVKPVGNGKHNMERTALSKKDDSSRLNTLAQKRRTIDSMQQFESLGPHSEVVGQRSMRTCSINVKGSSKSGSLNNSVKRNIQKQDEGVKATTSKDMDIVSFLFNAPVRPNNRSSTVAPEKQKGQFGAFTGAFNEKKVTVDAENRKLSPVKATELKGDALGALLEQKLRELTSLEADELETGACLQGKTTAAILEELISALSTRCQTSKDDEGNNLNDGSCYKTPYQSDRQATSTPVISSSSEKDNVKADASLRFSLLADCDNPSPTSILDASFSNESCLSESLDSGSAHDLQTNHPHSVARSSSQETDICDSATSVDTGYVQIENASNFIDKVTRIHGFHPAENGITESNCIHAREVISNVEHLFENLDQLTFTHVLDRLETLAETRLKNNKKYLWGFMETKEGNKFRRFLFDCLVECLDSMYSCYSKASFCVWSRLSLHLTLERVAGNVNEKIIEWNNLAGNVLDELIEKDLRGSMWKWTTDFEMEAFEIGYKIEGDILAALLDEVTDDLW
ncbi:uncharacterized protein [Aristolochia californica]|uniref:uncharacterized protein n=1 Tax=Aristolochia californica TaxID=171875 RepID=UPI0035DC0920